MRAEIANADGALKPGQFVRVALKGAVRNNAIAVPQVAVQDGPQGKFVYVTGKDKDGKDIAVVRPITLGDWVEVDGVNLWIVESGLAAGDTVIVDGIAKLQPGRRDRAGRHPAARTGRAGGAPPPGGKGPGKDAPPAKDSAKGGGMRAKDGAADGAKSAPRAPSPDRETPIMFSRFFIDRPIFAAVISVFFVLAGLAAMRSLPIAQYPEIAPPVVTVQAVYPGASAEVLEQTVAAPLENAINGVQGMLYMELALDGAGRHGRSRSRSRSAPTSTTRRSTSTTA